MAAKIVWAASFPKSGSTWFRLLLANWRSGSEQPYSINDLADPGGEAITRGAFDEATLLASGILDSAEIDSLRPAVYRMLAQDGEGSWFIKVHEAYRRNAAGEALFGGDEVGAAIYIVRDPRDIATSFACHLDTPVSNAIRIMNSSGAVLAAPKNRQAAQLPQPLLGWSGHVESWLDQTDIPVHVVRYEDLTADTAAAFGAALEFLGEPRDSDRLERAISHSRFSELKRQEQESGFRERLSVRTPFFRRGEVGSWRYELQPEQVRKIEDENRRVMERLGYLPVTTEFLTNEVSDVRAVR